jgi:hypothetical protein
LIFEYDKVIVGGTLSALMFAFIKDYPLLFTYPLPPTRFDFVDPKLDLSSFKIPTQNKTLTTFDRKLQVGPQKKLLWERILFLLSLRGNAPLSNMCRFLRHVDNNIVCSNEYSKIMEVRFKKCFYFTDPNTTGFVQKTKFDSETYLCYDHIAFNSGGKHEIDFIDGDDDFVGKIWFYSSDRIDGNTPVRDACAVSQLTKQQLQDFDFSETMARFKAIQMMKDRGMRGKFNGYTEKGTPRHYDFRTSSIRREIRSLQSEIKAAADCIEIKNPSEKNLLQLLEGSLGPYDTILEFLDEDSS